jgi:hypothetical protein
MNLDELHKVMKGDMTIDQACDGMTDDFEIGHVSHRADGDYRKVAQGKWVPVKAAGQAREFSETENHGAQLERQKKADAQTKKDEAVREQRAQGEAVGKSWKTAAEEWIKKNPNYKEMSADEIIKGISEHMAASEKPAEQQGGNKAKGAKPAEQKIKADDIKYGSIFVNKRGHTIEIGGWDSDGKLDFKVKGNDDGDVSNESTESPEELAKYMEGAGFKPAKQKGGGTESDGPNTAMQDERSQFKFRKHITHAIPMGKEEEIALNRISSYFESGKRNASDAIDNYADHLIKENMENGNNNEAQERAVMRIAHAIGYGHELHDKIKRGRNGYDFGYDDEQGSFYEGDKDDLEEASNELKERREQMYNNERYGVNQLEDAAAPARLTRDTKIRLSQVKREQTQDKKYNVGEISQKTGLQKQQDGSWAPPKQGRGSAYQESDKKVEALRGRGFNRTQLKNMRTSELDKLYEREMGAPAGGKAEVNPITGKPLRPETVAYAKQKKAEAEQKRNTEKTAGGFTLAQNDKIKNAALDVITKRRGERLTAKNLKRDYKMSDEEANETVRRVNEYFENLQKDRKEFSKR